MSEDKDKEQQKHPGGRPTLYTPDMPDRLQRYIEDCPDELPTKCGFAVFVGVCEDTLDNWGRKVPQFFGMLRLLKAKQHRELINKGLIGSYSSVIAKLLLCSDHGHTDRTDTTSGGKEIKSQTVDFSALCQAAREAKATENVETG